MVIDEIKVPQNDKSQTIVVNILTEQFWPHAEHELYTALFYFCSRRAT